MTINKILHPKLMFSDITHGFLQEKVVTLNHHTIHSIVVSMLRTTRVMLKKI